MSEQQRLILNWLADHPGLHSPSAIGDALRPAAGFSRLTAGSVWACPKLKKRVEAGHVVAVPRPNGGHHYKLAAEEADG